MIGRAAACAFEWTYHWSKQQKLAYQHSRKFSAKMHAKTAFPGAGRGTCLHRVRAKETTRVVCTDLKKPILKICKANIRQMRVLNLFSPVAELSPPDERTFPY